MSEKIFIGIDTSNYTSSVCAFCPDGAKTVSKRKILPVKPGQRGLRQSDAVFEHIRILPSLYKEMTDELKSGGFDIKNISAVGVSVKPRNIDGSYMPVFTAGKSFAEVIAASLDIPLYTFSHQEGHIAAAVAADNKEIYLKAPFISVHLSGGTCEILASEYKNGHFICDIIGKTSDISAGQFIDRAGVCMGLTFPCGKELEKTALKSSAPYKLPVSVKGSDISFSGVETKVCRLIEKSSAESYPDIAGGIFLCIAKSLQKAVINAYKSRNNICEILFAGGVSANEIIRKNIRLPVNTHFCAKEYTTDNALGIAYLTMLNHEPNTLSERGEQ